MSDKIEQKKKVTNGAAKSGGKLEQLFKSATAEELAKPSAPAPANNETNDTGKNLLRYYFFMDLGLMTLFGLERSFC